MRARAGRERGKQLTPQERPIRAGRQFGEHLYVGGVEVDPEPGERRGSITLTGEKARAHEVAPTQAECRLKVTGGYLAPFLNSGEATPGNVSLTLQGAAFLMGGSGENWIKDDLETPQGVCLVRALEYAAPNYESYSAAVDLLKQTVGESHLDRWNNAPATTYRDVQNALQSANNTLHPSFADRLSAIAGRVAGFFRNRS